MAINYGTGSSTLYLRTYDGSLIEDKGTEKPTDENGNPLAIAKLRPHKTKGQIWYIPVRSIEGVLSDIRKTTSTIPAENGREISLHSLEIEVKDADEKMVISLIWGSKAANSVMYVLPDVVYGEPVKIWCRDYQGNDYITICQQDDEGNFVVVKSAYPRGDESPIPPLEKTKFRGEERWDDSARLEFFENELNTWRQQITNTAQAVKAKATRPVEQVSSGDPELDALLDGIGPDDIKSDDPGPKVTGGKKKK